MEIITSKANSVIKNTKKLHQKKHRLDSYLIEGWHLFEEALSAGVVIRKIFVLEAFLDRVAGFPGVIQVTPEILKDLSDSQSPQGIVAEIEIPNPVLPEVLSGSYLILEDVQDPGNVGTLIRTADAAGYSGVLLSEKTADLYNLKTLRSMQGSHFHLPVYRLSMTAILDLVKQRDLPLIVTTLSKNSLDYRSLPRLENIAVVVGNEGRGVSPETLEAASFQVYIPMPGQAESLNVGVAAGILIFSLL